MNFKKIIFSLLLFGVLGEVLVRFDEAFTLLEDTHVVKVATTVANTPEYTMVKDSSTHFDTSSFRIMVLGDSYIHGAGIEFKDKFSQQLKQIQQKDNKKFNNVYVLDLSKPSSNTFDNTQIYFQFVNKFKPDVVVLGYNYNDIEGSLDKPKQVGSIDSFATTNLATKANESQSTAHKIYEIIYQSRFVHYVLSNLHTVLKSYGVVFPNSEFSLKMKAYPENSESWKKSKMLLEEMIEDAKNKKSKLIVLKFPEINLIEYPALFENADYAIKNFFSTFSSVNYVNGSDVFKGENSKQYILSKYDGHLNAKAHKKLASVLSTIIEKK